jgi:hypothetical protein
MYERRLFAPITSRGALHPPAVARERLTVGRHVENGARLTHHLTNISLDPIQRSKFEIVTAPQGSNESFGGKMNEHDVALFLQAAKLVSKVVAESEGNVLLFLGVGTGNPKNAWGNPTNTEKTAITEEDQREPAFLKDARQSDKKYSVIAINFNTTGESEGDIAVQKGDALLKIDVPGRFPLVEGELKDDVAEGMKLLKEAAAGVTRFAIMNAVTQIDYTPILLLAAAKKKGAGAYLKSYMATGNRSSFSYSNQKSGLAKASELKVMGDVFPVDE